MGDTISLGYRYAIVNYAILLQYLHTKYTFVIFISRYDAQSVLKTKHIELNEFPSVVVQGTRAEPGNGFPPTADR